MQPKIGVLQGKVKWPKKKIITRYPYPYWTVYYNEFEIFCFNSKHELNQLIYKKFSRRKSKAFPHNKRTSSECSEILSQPLNNLFSQHCEIHSDWQLYYSNQRSNLEFERLNYYSSKKTTYFENHQILYFIFIISSEYYHILLLQG